MRTKWRIILTIWLAMLLLGVTGFILKATGFASAGKYVLAATGLLLLVGAGGLAIIVNSSTQSSEGGVGSVSSRKIGSIRVSNAGLRIGDNIVRLLDNPHFDVAAGDYDVVSQVVTADGDSTLAGVSLSNTASGNVAHVARVVKHEVVVDSGLIIFIDASLSPAELSQVESMIEQIGAQWERGIELIRLKDDLIAAVVVWPPDGDGAYELRIGVAESGVQMRIELSLT